MNGISQDIITIALDAMGGDNAPVNDVAGAVKTVRETGNINIILVGRQDVIEKELKKHSYDASRISIFNCSEVIGMHDSPAESLKKKPDSSIVKGTSLVKKKKPMHLSARVIPVL